MSGKSGPRSKRERERMAKVEQEKQTKSKTIIYVGIAVVAVIAVAAAVWYLMQPVPVTMDEMKDALNDAGYETTDIPGSSLPKNAVSGVSFFVDVHTIKTTVNLYEFDSSDSAAAFVKKVPLGEAAVANGKFVIHSTHAHDGVLDAEIEEIFEDLLTRKLGGHGHDHTH